MAVQNNTSPNFNASLAPARQGDVMTMLAEIFHQLGNLRGDELRSIADDQKKIFARRKELGALKQKLSDIVSDGQIWASEWDEFEAMAKDLGLDTNSDTFTFMHERTRNGLGLEVSDSMTAEAVEATNEGVDRVDEVVKFEQDTESDELTMRQFDLQKVMQAFTTEHGESKKVLEKAERLYA